MDAGFDVGALAPWVDWRSLALRVVGLTSEADWYGASATGADAPRSTTQWTPPLAGATGLGATVGAGMTV
jgi:hypothetical protein